MGFATEAGVAPRARPGQPVDRARRGRGPGRRERLRQDHARARHPRRPAAPSGADHGGQIAFRRHRPADAPTPRSSTRRCAAARSPSCRRTPSPASTRCSRSATQIMDLMKWKSPRAARRRALAPAVAVALSRRAHAPIASRAGLLDAVQIPEPERLLRKYPHELSGGQRQRADDRDGAAAAART